MIVRQSRELGVFGRKKTQNKVMFWISPHLFIGRKSQPNWRALAKNQVIIIIEYPESRKKVRNPMFGVIYLVYSCTWGNYRGPPLESKNKATEKRKQTKQWRGRKKMNGLKVMLNVGITLLNHSISSFLYSWSASRNQKARSFPLTLKMS